MPFATTQNHFNSLRIMKNIKIITIYNTLRIIGESRTQNISAFCGKHKSRGLSSDNYKYQHLSFIHNNNATITMRSIPSAPTRMHASMHGMQGMHTHMHISCIRDANTYHPAPLLSSFSLLCCVHIYTCVRGHCHGIHGPFTQ